MKHIHYSITKHEADPHPRYVVGHHRRAVGSAWQIGFGNIGGIIAVSNHPQLQCYLSTYTVGLRLPSQRHSPLYHWVRHLPRLHLPFGAQLLPLRGTVLVTESVEIAIAA